MNTREKRWSVVMVAVSGLFLAGGLGGSARDALPGDGGAAHDLMAHAIPELSQDAFDPAVYSVEPSVERLAFQDQMRRLWQDHITWTRLYIVSAAADLPDKDLTAQRLLRNQAAIGNAVAAFYGEEAGAELTRLLEEHILGAADLLEAAKTGDPGAIQEASTNWYANGDEIAAFLSAANPDRWPLIDMQAQMKMHLDVTLLEATARLNGDYASDIAAYDEVEAHIVEFADLLSRGIIQQFPERFA